jgi:O-antigen ligase
MKVNHPLVLASAGLLGGVLLLLELRRQPVLFANYTYMQGLLLLEVTIACLWHFKKIFLPVTMWCFLAAGIGLPFAIESFTARWFFLGVGAFVGFFVWMRAHREHFGLFHLVALFCIFSALASASSSADSRTALLKVASLFLLFLYASTGARVALTGHEKSFAKWLVIAAETAAFLVPLAQLIGYPLFGNPNNMGAFIGVLIVPVLVWAVLTAEDQRTRRRRGIALLLCGVLLYLSVCRAAIAADIIVLVAVMFATRRPGFLMKVAFVGLLCIEILAVARPSQMGQFAGNVSEKFFFKKAGRQSGIFGSRRSPWDDTIAAVKQHPWFGTGFGTSDLGETAINESTIYTVEGTNREHGSSYLAMAEYMGLLGIVPFVFLLILVARAAMQAFAWMRRSGSAHHYAVPFALIIVAGLVHAAFEDWLFAIGSYLCVFFWISAFLLIDLAATAKADLRLLSIPTFRTFPRVPAFRQTTTVP